MTDTVLFTSGICLKLPGSLGDTLGPTSAVSCTRLVCALAPWQEPSQQSPFKRNDIPTKNPPARHWGLGVAELTLERSGPDRTWPPPLPGSLPVRTCPFLQGTYTELSNGSGALTPELRGGITLCSPRGDGGGDKLTAQHSSFQNLLRSSTCMSRL